MFTLSIEGDLSPAIEWCDRMLRFLELSKSVRANMILANLLTASHIHAFQQGGWAWRGGSDWSPTDGYWVEHLEGKIGNQPMM